MSFATAIDRVLGIEGGYTPGLPGDPGGETKFGISKRSYPNLDIKNLTREQAVSIYHNDFWLPLHADQMPTVLAFQAMDFAVNSGIQTAIRKLQACLGVADDGHWGPVTQAAVIAVAPAVLTFRFVAARLDYMRSLSNWPQFSKSWAGRIAEDLRDAAKDLLEPNA